MDEQHKDDVHKPLFYALEVKDNDLKIVMGDKRSRSCS